MTLDAPPFSAGLDALLGAGDHEDADQVVLEVSASRVFVFVADLGGRRASRVESFVTPAARPDFVARAVAAATGMLDGLSRPRLGVTIGVSDDHGRSSVSVLSPRPVPLATQITAAWTLAGGARLRQPGLRWAVWDDPAHDGGDAVVDVAEALGVHVATSRSGRDQPLPASLRELSNRSLVAHFLGRSATEAAQRGTSAAIVLARAREGDIRARGALLRLAGALGDTCADLALRFGATRIFVRGDVASAWDMIDSCVRGRIESAGSGPLQVIALGTAGRRPRGAALAAFSLSPERVA